MTRFARSGDANKKKPNEASSWQELKKSSTHGNSKKAESETTTNKKDKPAKTSSLHGPGSSTMAFKKKGKTKRTTSSNNNNNNKLISRSTTSTTTTKTSKNLKKSFPNKTISIEFDHDHFRQGSYQNSKSLIEELEEMDKHQLAEVNKQQQAAQIHQQPEDRTVKKMDKKELRSEERRLKRQNKKANKMVCYHCREPGHGVADCPMAITDAEQGTGVCYRCGSTEHDSSQCTARIDPNEGEFPFAKCFICQEMGHLSKSCPDNPKGLYPMGGGCDHCESVEHRSWNCPHNKTLKGMEEVKVSVYSSTSHQSADAEDFEQQRKRTIPKKKMPKVVKF